MQLTDEQICEIADPFKQWTIDGYALFDVIAFARALLSASKPAAPAQSAEPVATAHRVGRKGYVHWEISRHGDLVNGQKLYAAPQPSPTAVVLDDERAVFQRAVDAGGKVIPTYSDRGDMVALYADQLEALVARAASLQPVEQTEKVAAAIEMAYWNDNRAQILDAITKAGYRLESNRNGFWLHPVAQPVEQTRALTDDARKKMIADLEAEQTFISSSRERCNPDYELPRWDRLQAIIDHLSGGA